MASLLFKEMKGLNFSCTSPASTAAICATIDGSSLISSGAGRAIDRYNPHLRDPRRTKPVKPPALLPPQLTPSSKTKKKKKKTNNKSSDKANSTNNKSVTINNNTSASPGSSTRFLLNSDVTLSHDHHVFAEPEFLSVSSLDHKDHEPSSSSSSSSSSSIVTTATSSVTASDTSGDHAVVKPENQVVVLRVSLHCKGCEGKVRKHISKMEGVKSFFIDFAAKKVTVIGDVTPLGVLNSISKVKSAQFWPSPKDSSS